VDYFNADRSSTAWVGSVFNATPLLFGPIASIFVKRLGFRKATLIGGLMTAFGMFISIFVDSLSILCFTYGCISGFGISLPYLASSVVVMMYFKRRRSLATGLAECGAGVGTLIFAPLLQLQISEYGWRGALLVLSAIVSNIVLCGALFRPLPKTLAKIEYTTESQLVGFEISSIKKSYALQIDTNNKESRDCVGVEDMSRVENEKIENFTLEIRDSNFPNLGKCSNLKSHAIRHEHSVNVEKNQPENKPKSEA
jgi:MFS family permease